MATLFLTTAFTYCLLIGASIICNYGRPGEIAKTIAITAAIVLGLEAYTWAVIALVT